MLLPKTLECWSPCRKLSAAEFERSFWAPPHYIHFFLRKCTLSQPAAEPPCLLWLYPSIQIKIWLPRSFHYPNRLLPARPNNPSSISDAMSFCHADGWPCSDKPDTDEESDTQTSQVIDASRVLSSISAGRSTNRPESFTDNFEYSSGGYTITSASLHQHPHFWDNWGNVIVQAGCVIYRLHGTSLARHSQVFADILCGQPKFKANGVPIHFAMLDRTNARDFEVLLDVLENPLYVFFRLCRERVCIYFIAARTTSTRSHSMPSHRSCVCRPRSSSRNSEKSLYCTWKRLGQAILTISLYNRNGLSILLR